VLADSLAGSLMTDARVAVLYDIGSASPLEISRLTRLFAPMAVVLGDSAHAAAMAPFFEEFDAVLPAGASAAEQAEFLARWRPTGIVTFSERMLPRAAELAAPLGLPAHSPAVADLLTNKHRQRAALARAGISPVRSELLTTPAQWPDAVARVGLPAVVKPCQGEASRNTYLVTDPAQGGRLVRRLLAQGESALVAEEYLAGRPEPRYGDFVSVECVTVNGTAAPIAVTGKFPLTPPFREAGSFWPSHLDPAEEREVAGLAAAAVRALGVTSGLSHVEIKLTQAGPRILEVNGRLGGCIAELALRAAGTDLCELACRLALGETPDVPPVTPDRVYFHHNSLAPTYPCTVAEIRGGLAASQVPGIERFRPYVTVGDRLAGGVDTKRLDLLAGDAPDHATMSQVLAAALRQVTYVFDTDTGRRALPAADLTVTCRASG
jgi:biotin carboxylase